MHTQLLAVGLAIAFLPILCHSATAAEPILFLTHQRDLLNAWYRHLENTPAAETQLAQIREQLRKRAIELFGEVAPGNEEVVHALSGVDAWFDFEWYVVAPYLANAETSDLPPVFPRRRKGGYYAYHTMIVAPEVLRFVDLWRSKDSELEALRVVRAKLVDLNEKFFQASTGKHSEESETFDRQFDLEFYLTDNREHRDRLFRLAYGKLSKATEGYGSRKAVIALVPDVRASNLWYAYHRWYYAKAAGSDAYHQVERKPDVEYEQVLAFEQELKKLRMGNFTKRWKARIKKTVGLEK